MSYFNSLTIILFIFGHVGSSLLHGLFSSCGKWGLPLVAVHELLTEVVSLVVEHGLWGSRLQYLQHVGSAVVVPRL